MPGIDAGAMGLYVCLFIALYFEVFLLISFFEKRPERAESSRPRRYPSVTMLVPCYNEERTLAGTLDSLLALEYPTDLLEIVVVDDGSQDRTGAIAQEYATRYKGRVAYIAKPNGGKYTALNLGLERSRGEIVGCLDADSFVERGALVEAVKKFESDATIMAITPAMKVYKPRTLLELMQNVEYTFGIFYKKMFDNLAAINVLPGPFSLYKREVFTKIGLFRHAHNTEDMEIAFRMHANGLRIVNAHNAFVYTTVPRTVGSLLRQRVRWSQGFLMNARDYGYMLLNPRYGHFGMLVLPFGITAFFAGIYSALYTLYHMADIALTRTSDYMATGIPLHLPQGGEITWFYLNTGGMLFIILTVLSLTLTAIYIGNRMAHTGIGIKSLAAYFAFFGFLAPLWLARAAWGAAIARESKWR